MLSARTRSATDPHRSEGTTSRSLMDRWIQKLRRKRRRLGLCRECGSPVVPGRRRCMSHLLIDAAAQKRRKSVVVRPVVPEPPPSHAALWKRAARANDPARDKASRLRTRDRARERARHAVKVAVRTGQLHKPDHCEGPCQRRLPHRLIHGHHPHGYAKRNHLKVHWLCARCHKEAHRSPGQKEKHE